MKIGVDIDGVLNNLTEAVLEVYNEDSGDNLTVDDITDYMIEKFVKPEYKKDFPKYFMDKRVWKRVKPVQEAINLISKFYKEGNLIYFITSTEPYNLYKKDKWLQRIFPQMIFEMDDMLIRIKHKQLVDVDILVDDYSKNLKGKTHYFKILINKPWNQNIDDEKEHITRCYNWNEVEKAIYNLINEERNSKREN